MIPKQLQKYDMFIMRGLPGCGKDTLARSMGCKTVSADDYFVSSDGLYNFKPSELSKAHGACFSRAMIHCEQLAYGRGVPFAVCNTNTTAWEISPYLMLAQHYERRALILDFHPYPDIWLYAHRNTHGVPMSAIKQMRKRMREVNLPPFWDVRKVYENGNGNFIINNPNADNDTIDVVRVREAEPAGAKQ